VSALPAAAREGLAPERRRTLSDAPFYATCVALASVFVILIVAMLAADVRFTSLDHLRAALQSREVRYALRLSLVTCTLTTILCLWVAVPAGYLLSRFHFRGKSLVEAIFDIPIVLPPLVIGLSLLILFRTGPGRAIESVLPLTHAVPGVVLAQFMVACAFAVRTMRVTFDGIDPRHEQVALTLGSSRARAFWSVLLPEARRGVVSAATLAWARSLGEFGPIFVFSGTTRLRTEVLPSTVYLELGIGNIETAVAVSFIMVVIAAAVLMLARLLAGGRPFL
jgi:molybdate transport system permease protein